MKNVSFPARCVVATLVPWLFGVAAAQVPLNDEPGRRPVAQISRDLGITPEQFRSCFSGVSPSPAGQWPSADRRQANKAVLLACLQKVKPALANDTLDAVMDKYRPGGREAQLPPTR